MDIKIGDTVLSRWTVSDVLGSGAYGTVYKIEREEFGQKYYSALKVIQIPPDSGYVSTLKSEGMTDQDISQYVADIAKTFMREIQLLESLKGNSNIVCYEDHLIEQGDEASYTIMIRMELLSPLKDIMASQNFTERDVIKLGTDICNAIEKCESRHIIHRDIKPDNIFCSDAGEYKLGDFGVARTMEKTVSAMSQKGTYTYMAPEVFVGKEYDKTVDLYSLGVVLYQLMNKNRTPFLPNAPQPIKYSDRENAQKLRMSGEPVPEIADINSGWNAFFKVALVFNPSGRFQSAAQMRTALNNISNLDGVLYTKAVSDLDFDDKTVSAVSVNADTKAENTPSKMNRKAKAERNKHKPALTQERPSLPENRTKLSIALKAVVLLVLAFLGCSWAICLDRLFYDGDTLLAVAGALGLILLIAACILAFVNKSKKALPKRRVFHLLLDLGFAFSAVWLNAIDFFHYDLYWFIEECWGAFFDFYVIVPVIVHLVLLVAITVADVMVLNRLYKEKKSE